MTSAFFTTVSRAGAILAIAVLLLARHDFAYAQAQTRNQDQNQPEERWYQIEVTVFAHKNAMLEQEIWPMSLLQEPVARNTRPLDTLMSVYDLPDWGVLDNTLIPTLDLAPPAQTGGFPTDVLSLDDRASGAPVLRSSTFRLPDADRDAFLALPSSTHQFQDTNRALSNDGRYRVMYHNAWRQPMRGSNQSIPVWLEGGNRFGARHELEGSLTFRFNPGQDRVVLNARLWLTEFTAQLSADSQQVTLPDLPDSVVNLRMEAPATDALPWSAAKVTPVVNTRELRSNEFHYLDHPAVGILVQILPYNVPPLPEPEPQAVPAIEGGPDLDTVPAQSDPVAST